MANAANRTNAQIADRRKWLSFTMRPHQGPPPARPAVANSVYGGVKEAVDDVPLVPDSDFSLWQELEMFDRLEARRAISATRHYLFRQGDTHRLQVRYDGNLVYFRKYRVTDATRNMRFTDEE